MEEKTFGFCHSFLPVGYHGDMKIFALETDEEKLIQSFLSQGEEVILRVRFSAFVFVVRSLKALCFTAIFVAVGVALYYFQLPLAWDIGGLTVLWLFLVGWKWLSSYIDWRYDVLLVTTEELVILDQSSLFRLKIRQMNLDNLASVSSETMFFNLLSFGMLHFELKEGVGQSITLPYIPHAERVSSIISDAVVLFQRRRSVLTGAVAAGAGPAKADTIVETVAPAPPPKRVTDDGVEGV